MNHRVVFFLAALGAAGFGAAARAADAGPLWAQYCAACHGKDGAGHTKAGRMAGVKDLSDPAYQKQFTDAAAAAQIRNGLKDKDGRIRMKAFGETLAPEQIQNLVAYVRSLKR
jgi:mono/diheme cytochrome c family protein